MGSNTITPPVLNSNASGDEILGLLKQPPRRSARRETKSEDRDSRARDSWTRANEQIAMDPDDRELQRSARRTSLTDALAALIGAQGFAPGRKLVTVDRVG